MSDLDPTKAWPETGGSAITRMATRAARLMTGVANATNAVRTLVVLGPVLFPNTEMIARNAFNAPCRGTYKTVQFQIVLTVFLQMPDVMRINRLIRSDGFFGRAGKPPTSRRAVFRMRRRYLRHFCRSI